MKKSSDPTPASPSINKDIKARVSEKATEKDADSNFSNEIDDEIDDEIENLAPDDRSDSKSEIQPDTEFQPAENQSSQLKAPAIANKAASSEAVGVTVGNVTKGQSAQNDTDLLTNFKVESATEPNVSSPSTAAAALSPPPISESRSPVSVPSPSIRRHALNRAPSFQSSLQSNFQPSSQPVYQSNDRIAIFIDGSNLFYAASHLNIEVDYRRLLSTLVRGRRLLRAYFYTGVDPQNEKQRGFLLWLNRHGHRVVSKELALLPDGSRKANMHVEMAVDMMRISEYCSTLTLLGGDGNLAYALEVLSRRGTSIEVVSLQSMTSDSLIDLADTYTDLADLRDEIKR